MTRNNKKANDATRVRRMETFAKRAADNDQKPPGKLVGADGGGKRPKPKSVGITLAHISMMGMD
jgi:hypothetical protein